ncbi:MraY family glycosyltransferase [Emcibacter sp. SYSU 3D8]|uniref:MraY family glycosyltransferase n=1 Tax=Emcibacter sp. SYSU 3D8 TaxID=3133969 RepID=UPI0031FE5C55
MDKPDGARKLHTAPTPLVGGIGLFLALCAGVALQAAVFGSTPPASVAIAAVSGVFFLLGFMDDRRHINPWLRLAVGIVGAGAAAIAVPSLRVGALWFPDLGFTIPLGMAAVPFTVFCVLCLKHGSNLSDGLNGLFLGMCILWLLLLAPWMVPETSVLLLPTAGALAVLLVANLKGRLFTGDSGAYMMSSLIGFAAIEAYASHRGGMPALYLGACFLIPVLDMGRVMAVRIRRGTGAFTPGRDHLHHYLKDWTGSSNRAVAVYLALCSIPALHAYLDAPLVMVMALQVVAYAATLSVNRARGPEMHQPARGDPQKPAFGGGSFKHSPKPYQNRE